MKKYRVTVNGNTYEVLVEETDGVAAMPAVTPVVTPAAPAAPAAAPAAPAAPAGAPVPPPMADPFSAAPQMNASNEADDLPF